METFNKDLDKITEREVVYDFVERLKTGIDHDIDSCGITLTKDTNLYEIINYIMNILPASIISKINNNKIFFSFIDVADSDTSNSVEIPYDCNLIAAYSDKTRLDVSSALNINKSENKVTITYNHSKYNFCKVISSVNVSSYNDIIILVLEKIIN